MSFSSASTVPSGAVHLHRRVVNAALLATLVLLTVFALAGFPTLYTGRGDNDGMLRVVEVRELLAGQSWFDLMQYRLGPEGTLMHWSRLIDAPIAALILAAQVFGLSEAAAETFAAVAWPLILFCIAMMSVLYAAVNSAGPRALIPATLVAGASFYYIGFFAPAALDHHNAQLTLTLVMLAGLTAGGNRFSPAAIAGAAASAMLAIGMETAPYVAVGGFSVAALFLLRGEKERGTILGFGLGFGALALIIFPGTVATNAWFRATCDAYSIAQFVMAAVGGFGIAALASVDALAKTLQRRALGLGALGVTLAGILIVAFPECLGDPFATFDPWLMEHWLSRVSEAQSFFDIARDRPAQLIAFYGYGLLAIGILLFRTWRRGVDRADMLILGVLCATFAVSVWQVRGSLFLIPMSAIPLAGWIADARSAVTVHPSVRHSLRMVGAWTFSFVLVWISMGVGVNLALAAMRGTEPSPMSADTGSSCYNKRDYAALANEATTTVLSFTNLGSAILLHTPHRALAGPYHRNVEGNLLALQTLLAPVAEARGKVAESGATIVAWCPGNAEAGYLASVAPNSLAAMLNRNEPPSWLAPIESSVGGDLILYRVQPGT